MRHRGTKHTLAVLAAWLLAPLAPTQAAGADVLAPLDLREVKVGGEIGRRMDVTISNNLLVLDVDRDFLRPFLEEQRRGDFIGLGMLLDAAVKFAAYSGDPKALALRKHLVAEILRAQEADGYIGTFPPPKRIRSLWDVHEMGYVIWGLLTDHQYFGEAPSLAAARKAADYLVKNWSVLPPDWGVGADVAPHVAFTGLERTMIGLHRATSDPAYLAVLHPDAGVAPVGPGDRDRPPARHRRPRVCLHGPLPRAAGTAPAAAVSPAARSRRNGPWSS